MSWTRWTPPTVRWAWTWRRGPRGAPRGRGPAASAPRSVAGACSRRGRGPRTRTRGAKPPRSRPEEGVRGASPSASSWEETRGTTALPKVSLPDRPQPRQPTPPAQQSREDWAPAHIQRLGSQDGWPLDPLYLRHVPATPFPISVPLGEAGAREAQMARPPAQPHPHPCWAQAALPGQQPLL